MAGDRRSQPSNILLTDSGNYLIDVGDGAASQLGKAKVPLRSVDSIFISHLHFDHIGGLPAIMGLRYQINAKKPLTIYGPPGTKETVDGIFAYMAPHMRVGYAVPGAPRPPTPQETTVVVEVVPGETFEVNGMTVKAVENSHFSLPEGSEAAELNKSYAYRFDLPDRSIVYTGDTGPSEAIEELARGADLLVSEMMDVPFIVDNLRRDNAKREFPAPDKVMDGVAKHLSDHHVTAKQVGEMAARAGVKEVVVTHFAGKEDAQSLEHYKADIAKGFNGEVSIASDMEKH